MLNSNALPGMTNPPSANGRICFQTGTCTARVARWPAHSVRWQVVRLKPRCPLSINSTAAAIRKAYFESGELSVAVELSRHFPGSRTTRTPDCACVRSPTGSHCRPYPQRSHGHAGPDHRRDHGLLHPCQCDANAPVGDLVDCARSDRLLSELVSRRLDRPLQNRRCLEPDGFAGPDPDGCTRLWVQGLAVLWFGER